MAGDIRVHISDALIISALNTPGGGIFKWRDRTGRKITEVAQHTSPVNDPLNAMHRGGVVGTYRASWGWDRRGSGGHRVRARIYNTSDHAYYVEYGRLATSRVQRFSWTEWGGKIGVVGLPKRKGYRGTGTAYRRGEHVLRNACVTVLGITPG